MTTLKKLKELYIAINGNDSNYGTIDMPLATLEKARNVIRNAKKSQHLDDGDITVFLRAGRYFRNCTFELNEEDSGQDGAKITYKAYPGEQVFIDGGIVIEPSNVKSVINKRTLDRIIEEDARAHIQEIYLSQYRLPHYGVYGNRGFRRAYIPAPNELFIDNHPQTVAQWPNAGEPPVPLTDVIDSGSEPIQSDFSMRPATFRYNIDRPDKWTNVDDLYISGIFCVGYADDTIKVRKIDLENKTITTGLPHLFSFYASFLSSWRAVNLLEEIDIPGEYYIDRNNEKIYFYPPYDVKNSLIQLSVMEDPMVSMENVSFINFEDMTFENSRGTGFYIEEGSYNHIRGCTIRNIGMVAVQVGQGTLPLPEGKHNAHGEKAEGVGDSTPAARIIGNWHERLYEIPAWNNKGGRFHGIVNCEISNTGTGGILLGGGDRKTLFPACNFVENCHIHDINRLDKSYKSAVNISGVGNTVRHCHIHDLEGSAIYLHGNDHTIEYNKIHDVLKSTSDQGAIYMGRDMSEVGNVFRYNFIYGLRNPHKDSHFGICAIYFDDGAIFNAVYGNYFYDIKSESMHPFSTIFWNWGGLTSVANNIFIDCYPGINPNIKSNSYKKMHSDPLTIVRVTTADQEDYRGVDITSEPYRSKYPYLYDTYMNNYLHTTLYWNNAILYNQYDQFEDTDPGKLNFKCKKDSWILNISAENFIDRVHGISQEHIKFEEIDFERIGIVK